MAKKECPLRKRVRFQPSNSVLETPDCRMMERSVPLSDALKGHTDALEDLALEVTVEGVPGPIRVIPSP
jgi:hypothetical protein